MNRRIGLVLLASGMLGLGACASAPQQSSAPETDLADAKSAPTGTNRSHCITETGSRIKPADGECLPGPGVVVTRDELERSGSIRALDQLRRLPGM